MKPPTISYKCIFNSVTRVIFLFWPFPIFSCSFSFQILSSYHHVPFHICFFFPPSFFFYPSFFHPYCLLISSVFIKSISIPTMHKKGEILLFTPNLITFFVACSHTFVYFCFTGFDLKLIGVIGVLTSIGFRSRPAARPALKPLCKRNSSARLPDYHSLKNCEKTVKDAGLQ